MAKRGRYQQKPDNLKRLNAYLSEQEKHCGDHMKRIHELIKRKENE